MKLKCQRPAGVAERCHHRVAVHYPGAAYRSMLIDSGALHGASVQTHAVATLYDLNTQLWMCVLRHWERELHTVRRAVLGRWCARLLAAPLAQSRRDRSASLAVHAIFATVLPLVTRPASRLLTYTCTIEPASCLPSNNVYATPSGIQGEAREKIQFAGAEAGSDI